MALNALPIVHGVTEARSTILLRNRSRDAHLSRDEREVIKSLFNEDLSATEAVERIVIAVRKDGDEALRRFSTILDGFEPQSFVVSEDEFFEARKVVDDDIQRALQVTAERVRHYHERQLENTIRSFDCGDTGQIVGPIRRVGLYVPGTETVYPSSVLHTAIPAIVAGVDEIVITSPISPAFCEEASGRVSPLKLVAADIAGVSTVFKIGGAQAIAALAYGTETIEMVDKIFGPGNRFVTEAKRLVFGDVGIDAVYGPTETVIVADDSAKPELCAADLLAQAEHDVMAVPILITSSVALAETVARLIPEQAAELERGDIALTAIANQGGIVVTDDIETAVELANDFAPEHMALMMRDAERYVRKARNAGGLFIGETSPEALADYVAGPSHVMPTGGGSRHSSPLHVGEFLKITSVLRASSELLEEMGPTASLIARAEGLTGHANSIDMRLQE